MVGKGPGRANTASNSVERNTIDRMRPTTEIVNSKRDGVSARSVKRSIKILVHKLMNETGVLFRIKFVALRKMVQFMCFYEQSNTDEAWLTLDSDPRVFGQVVPVVRYYSHYFLFPSSGETEDEWVWREVSSSIARLCHPECGWHCPAALVFFLNSGKKRREKCTTDHKGWAEAGC